MFKTSISIIGCGWLGTPLAERLLARNHLVRGSTTSAEKVPELQQRGIETYELDLSKSIPAAAGPLFRSEILFVNVPPGVRHGRSVAEYEQMMERARSAAEAGSVKRVLQASSTGVYAGCSGNVSEMTTVEPDTRSGKAVWAAEQVWAGFEELTILRLAGLAGPGRRPARWVAGKTDLPDADKPVNMVHQEDCLNIIERVLHTRLRGTFNVCADRHPSRQEFYKAQCRRDGLAMPDFQEAKPGDTDYKIVDNRRLREQLGYTYRFPDPCAF